MATDGIVNRLIDRFNDWLASERGFIQAVAVSLVWNIAVAVGVDKHGFLYLFCATELGLITQFTLAIIGRRSGAKLDRALEQLQETSEMLLQLARNESTMQEALIAQTDAIAAALPGARPRKPGR